MKLRGNHALRPCCGGGMLFNGARAVLPADIKAKAKLRSLKSKPGAGIRQVVGAVQAYNAAPPTEAKGMTNEKWKSVGRRLVVAPVDPSQIVLA